MTISPNLFDAADADVVLLTTEGDNIREFHVHRGILAAASPFFNDMFSLPQAEDELLEKKPVISVTDSSDVLDKVLRMVYPFPPRTIATLDELTPILAVATKYDFTAVIDVLRKLLVSPPFLETSPLRVYAIACRYDLDDEMRIASRHTLDTNITEAPLLEELKYVDEYSYHRLLKLHRQRVSAAQALLKIPDNIKCMQCNGSPYTFHTSPKWWHEFERRAREELAARPTTNVIFGLEFLFRAAQATHCARCPENILDSWRFLRELKDSIDALPSTV